MEQSAGLNWTAGETLEQKQAESLIGSTAFNPIRIPDHILTRMKGKSLPDGPCRVSVDDLRYIRLLHYNLEGQILKGEMVVSKDIANDVSEIFFRLYQSHYPIERIQLIDDFDAKDEESMRHNNSSAFCYRVISGTNRLSNHALGRAVDINPLYNPYFKVVTNAAGDSIGYRSLEPENATPYVNRSADFPYKLVAGDWVVRLFKEKGFIWGGDWTTTKDYQHFEKK
ncbi:MAG: M15 family metallopeptidase [Bacteroidaceae bacterium]|nr:M15 family metallopeptidase [Bacteroidaceae bacterium]